jgi:hypothetical protein
MENEVTNDVGALDGVGVVIKRVEEPGVVRRDELTRALICPEHILAGRLLAVVGGSKLWRLTSRASFLCILLKCFAILGAASLSSTSGE